MNFDAKSFASSVAILGKSDEFQVYVKFLQQQIELRKDQIIGLDISKSEGVSAFNFIKGEISGLETAMLLPKKISDAMENDKLLDLFEQDKLDDEANIKENNNGR